MRDSPRPSRTSRRPGGAIADFRIPEDALITDYTIDVLRGDRDDGTPSLVLRITDQGHGTISWVTMASAENARRLGQRLLAMADELDGARRGRGDDDG